LHTSLGIQTVETISYYNDSEPNWDERPYFRVVEERRGRAGLHVNADSTQPEIGSDRPGLWPGNQPKSATADWMSRSGHRVLLSGIGGDEFLGGVPTPIPELEDLLATGRFRDLAHQLKVWALVQRRPWLFLLRDATTGFLPSTLRPLPKHRRPPSWLQEAFVKRHRETFLGDRRWTVFGTLPSFQENLSALDGLRRQLAATELRPEYPYETRYPYLDRDLLEFLFAIPRDQLVRPGERRSLMRRALRSIVPDEILDRKRKAYVTKSPLALIARQDEQLTASHDELIVGALGIVAPNVFHGALQDARQGKEVPIVPLLRALSLERWLRGLKASGYLKGNSVSIESPEFMMKQTPANSTSSSPVVA